MSKLSSVLLAYILLAGCTTTRPATFDAPTTDIACSPGDTFDPTIERSDFELLSDHVIRLNKDGVIVAPADGDGQSENAVLSPADAKAYVQNIICKSEQYARFQARGGPVNARPMVFVHGGLNTFSSVRSRVLDQRLPSSVMCSAQNGCAQGPDDKYPIFVAWPSGPASTYFEHLFGVREGRKVPKWVGIPTSPFIFASDLFKSVGQFPETVFYQLTNEKDRAASAFYPKWLAGAWTTSAQKFGCDALSNRVLRDGTTVCDRTKLAGTNFDGQPFAVEANLSTYKYGVTERLARGAQQTLTFIPRYTVGSLWHSGITSAAWSNMKRRTLNSFYPPHYFDGRWTGGVSGGFFFELLLHRVENLPTDSDVDYDITLIGHSMGAIVLDNTLSHFQSRWINSGALKNIVYMAAASTVNESLESLAPVLNGGTKLGKPINFYNLTLNRTAEVSEMHAWGLIPLGSLLVSIDQHHEKPEHPLARTIGSEVNVLSAIEVIDQALRDSSGRLVFKAFDRKVKGQPSEHGGFGEIEFWKCATWELPTTQSYCLDR